MTSEETLAAVAYLFSLNLRQVPPGVIHHRFGELIKSLLELLARNFRKVFHFRKLYFVVDFNEKTQSSTALLKALVTCLGTVLRRGTTVESWENQDAKAGVIFLSFLSQRFEIGRVGLGKPRIA